MATFVELGSGLRPLQMTAKHLNLHSQDVRTPPAMTSDSQDASLDHLLAHLESSKQALEHQVQQLLQENRLSKSAKKEQQWHVEGERLHSKLDGLNVALMEKEERVRQLEKELRDARGSLQQVQSRCREVEKEKERGSLERARLQADLEDLQSNFQNLEREHKVKHEVTEKQRLALKSLAEKVEKQRVSFQNELEDARRKLIDSEEREQKYELSSQLASQHLAEKERQLKSLRDAHENLLAVQKDKQAEEKHEAKEVILALESTQAKCEEQNMFIQELEKELGRSRKEAHQLDARVAAAEADASSKASMLEKVQLELSTNASQASLTAISKAQTEDLRAQLEALKRNLLDIENTLSEESALRFKAEVALNEYKVREKTFWKVEQDGKVLQEEVKWRNEQFDSLEEAHNKMRDQFHEGLSMWASEKAAILHDVEVLSENVQSRDIAIHDLLSQVKYLEQSLAHEENCRKLLEFQLTDAKAGYENVSAEYLGSQSIFESLIENSKKELAFLKDTLVDRDNQLKELHAKQSQIDRDQKMMMHLEDELDRNKSRCQELQQALEKESANIMETGLSVGLEEREALMKSLTDAEATIAAKSVEMKELEVELDRTRNLSEHLRTSLAEAEEKRVEVKSGATRTVEQISASLSAKEQRAMELELEVERLQVTVNDVRECNSEAQRRIKALEDRLRDAHRDLQAKSDHSHSLLNVQEHEEVVLAMRSECETLRRQVSTCDFEKFEIEKDRDKLLAEQKQLYQKEKQELNRKLEHLGKQLTLKDTRLKDLLDQIEREKRVIRTLEARCSSSEQELSKQVLLAEKIREELIAEKLNARVHQERAHVLDAALSADAAAKDASLKEIKDTLNELKVLCEGDDASCQTQLRISSIEEKLEKQDVLHGSVDGGLASLLTEVERVAQGVAFLNIELNSLKDDSKLTKTEFETRLRAVEGLFSSSLEELQKISVQVKKMNAERTSLVDVLNNKESDLKLLSMENSGLNIENTRLESNADILEEKLLQLVKEAEGNKCIIDTLNLNMKAAEDGVATLHELHVKLEVSENKNLQLQSVGDQARSLERKVRKTEEIVRDKEQRLAASKWAVQQLAGEIAKFKSSLKQKEKDEAAQRERLEHLEAELKVKEREVMALQCDLENAVKTSNDNVAVVQQLTLSRDEIGHVLELTTRSLEAKTATLATSEAEVKHLLESRRVADEAFESCKEQLSTETRANSTLEMDIKRLCEDLEKTNQEASLADADVKNLQEKLQCLERTTEARLESCERKMEKGAADLSEYQESCAGLLALIEKKDARIQQLESEMTHAEIDLGKQIMQTEKVEQELHFLSEQLKCKTKLLSSLKVEISTADVLVKESEMLKRGLEEEVRGLKSTLSVATRDLKQKSMEVETQKRSFEHIQSLLSQQGEAHSKELHLITSNAIEERDSKVSNLQAALDGAHDDLRNAQEAASVSEDEKRVLSLRLSELESLVEKGRSQISQLHADVQVARMNLEAETERVWHQVAIRNEIETELDAWKGKAAALTMSQAEYESQISRLQAEVNDWKEVADHTKSRSQIELDAWELKVAKDHAAFEKSQVEVMEWKTVAERTHILNAELEKSLQAVQESVVGWESIVTSLADEGQVAKLQLDVLMTHVHDEYRILHGELANTKDVIAVTRQEGLTLKVEFLSTVEEALKEQTALALTSMKEKEQHEIRHLQAVVSDLNRDLSLWKGKALNSEVEAQSQLDKWRQRAEEWEAFNDLLEQAFLDFELTLLECKSDPGSSVSDVEKNLKGDIQVSFQNLRKEVEEAKSEMMEFKELAALESRRAQLEFQDSLNSLQLEVEVWKEKAGVATEESLQLKYQFEDLLKNLRSELKNWKQFEEMAFGKDRSVATDSKVAGESIESSVTNIHSINPFDQEDEGCSSAQDSDDAASSQFDEWKTSSLAEGRKLTRQLRTSMKHLRFVFESRNQAPKIVKQGSIGHGPDDTGLESLVKALQEETVEIKAELADWKKKALENGILKEDLERTIGKLNAEMEVWKDRSAMSAGQRIVARRQLDDFANQVKSLHAESQKWKDLATEANEGATKLDREVQRLQNEIEDVRGETNEWMQKALELNCVNKDLEQNCKQRGEISCHELENLRAEVERWRSVALKAEEEGKVAKIELLHTFGKLEDDLEVMSSNSIGGCSTAEGRSFKDEDLDSSWQTSGRVSNEWRRELEISLQVEVEDWKKKASEQQDLRQAYETIVKELRIEVDAWKKSADSIAEDRRRERVELEKMKDLEAKVYLDNVQAELQAWKKRAADATEECTSLRDTHDSIIKELQSELAHWKQKSETATEECQSVRTDLENVVQELQNQVYIWKQKAEKALENVVKNQEYEDLIKALEEELSLWTHRTQESKVLQLQLEKEQWHLQECLTSTQNDLQKWKDKAAAAVTTTSIQSLPNLTAIPEEEDEVNVGPLTEEGEYDEEEDEANIDHAFKSQQLQKWKSRAEHAELLQLQLEDVLAETHTELNDWKQKAADFSLAAEFLKEELESLIEECRLEKEELARSNSELEAWRERAQDSETQLESSNLALQKWEEKAAAITRSTRTLMQELDLSIEEGQLEKQEFYSSIRALKSSVLVWKEKVAESDSIQSQLKASLLETKTELQDWKGKAAVAIATNSEHSRQQNEKLCNTLNETQAELEEWKLRAQEGVSVQLQLERALLENEEKAGNAATDMQALQDELNRTVAESSSEIQELCSAITGLESELSELRVSGTSRFPQLLQLQNALTETQSQLQMWQDKATVASQAEEELRQAVEQIRAETGILDNFIRALKDELLEWKGKAEHLETLQLQLTSSLASSEAELQRWKQKATEIETNRDLQSLATELSQWKVKAQEGEFLHQQTKKSLTDTQTEIKELKEQIAALNLFTYSLKDELRSANALANTLTTQINAQKHKEASLQTANGRLEADLVLAREEAFSRKQKMRETLIQLQGSIDTRKELQNRLHMTQHRLLGNEKFHSQAARVNLGVGDTAASKANNTVSSDVHDGVSFNFLPETELPSKSHTEAPEMMSEVCRVSVKNPSVDKMRQEPFSLKSSMSKLGHGQENDVVQSQSSFIIPSDDDLKIAEECSTPRAAASMLSRPEAVLQKQVESCKAVEGGPQMRKCSDATTKTRFHNVARIKVLADVNGNSPRATANHDVKLQQLNHSMVP